MFDETHYVPILKAKQGELHALAETTLDVARSLTPLMEVPRVPWDHEKDREQKTLEAHVKKIAKRLSKAWASGGPIFLDLPFVDDGGTLPDGRHVMTKVMDDARDEGLQAIPTTALDRGHEYQDAVRRAVQADDRGACLRLEPDNFARTQTLTADIDALLGVLAVVARDVDVVIDLAEVTASQVGTLALGVASMLGGLPYVAEWRSVTLAGAGFPENLSGFRSDTISRAPRSDWLIWRSLRERSEELPRLPTFGDYAVQHPDPPEIDPRIMTMAASLRYTADDEWVIVKGRSIKEHGSGQFNDLCSSVVGMSDYSGPSHCWGDVFIRQCAEDEAGPGNPTTWRKVATSHHLALVTEQLASLA